MRCDFEQLEAGKVRCRKCGREILTKHPPRKVVAVCSSGKPTTGPGSQLRAILENLGIGDLPGCNCASRIAQMNEWGPAGCRENFATIRGWLLEGAAADWLGTIKAATAAVVGGLPIDPLDPAGGLVRLAIERSEKYD